MASNGPVSMRATLQKLMTFNVAGVVILADQGLQLYVRSQVTIIEAKPITPWLALIWQTVTPGHPLPPTTWAAWVGMATLVMAALAWLIKKQAGTFDRLQMVAFGTLLGGTASRLLDLLHWHHAVRYLWLDLPDLRTATSVASIMQWVGLVLLGLIVLRRRRATA